MIIEYNEIDKNFYLTPKEVDVFTNNVTTVKYEVNCCYETNEAVRLDPMFKIFIPLDVYLGTMVINSITIGNNVYACPNNACNINDLIKQDYIAGSITTDVVDNNKIFIIKGVPLDTTISIDVTINNNPIQARIERLPLRFQVSSIQTQGIHTFTLSTTTDQNVVVTETACYFQDKELICILANFMAQEQNKNTDAHLLYNIIKESVKCNCGCSDLCKIYRELLLELNILDRCKIC